MKKKEFVIPVYINSESDLYSRYDPYGKDLDSSLKEYLSDCLLDRGFMEKVKIVLHSPNMPDMDRFNEAYVSFIEKLKDRNKKEIKKQKTSSLRLFLIGVAFISNGIILNGYIDQVITVIISTIGSFSIWEASAIWIKFLPELRMRKLLLRMLSQTKPEYSGENIYPGSTQ